MNASAIKDLHYSRYVKILSKLHEPLYDWEITNARALICTAVQLIKN